MKCVLLKAQGSDTEDRFQKALQASYVNKSETNWFPGFFLSTNFHLPITHSTPEMLGKAESMALSWACWLTSWVPGSYFHEDLGPLFLPVLGCGFWLCGWPGLAWAKWFWEFWCHAHWNSRWGRRLTEKIHQTHQSYSSSSFPSIFHVV